MCVRNMIFKLQEDKKDCLTGCLYMPNVSHQKHNSGCVSINFLE